MASQNDSVSLPRKLTKEETKELKIALLPYFHTADIAELGPEDVGDFLDYAFAMISNQKPIDFVVQELKGMEMDFCPPEVADKVGQAMIDFLQPLIAKEEQQAADEANGEEAADAGDNQTGERVVSLKVSVEG